jgi:hypothetical protein
MNGARFVHDRLEEHGRDVLIADATKARAWQDTGDVAHSLAGEAKRPMSPTSEAIV